MINIRRIRWTYEHFGVACAIRSATYDLVATVTYIGYCFTLPFQFVWMVWKELK